MPVCSQSGRVAVLLGALLAQATGLAHAAGGAPGTAAASALTEDEQSDLGSPAGAVDRIYRLAGSNDLQAANRLADAALARFPGSAPLWEAAAYVRRGAGDYAGALEAYRRAGDLAPADADAIKGQALMLDKVGAVAPAAALVLAHPELETDPDLRRIVAEQAALDLRYAESAEQADERLQRLRQAAARLDALIASGGGEIAAARSGEAAPFDRIQADVLLHREADAVARYERLTAAAIEVPAYARYQAAVAYARLRQSARAIPILRQLVQERPDDVDSQLELFYALVDTDQLAAAREHIDRLDQRLSSTADRGDLVRVRIAAAMARAYDEHPAQAVARLDRVLEQAPFNPDARADRATVYLWRGWPRRARGEADAVLTVAPHNADARALQIQADMALDDWRSARAALSSDSAAQDLRERDLIDLRQRLSWHDRPEVAIESGFGTGSQTNVATYRDWFVDTRATTALIDQRYRFFGHLRQAHTEVAPSALIRTWGGAGVEAAGRALSGSLELAGVQGEPAPAAVLRATWQPADGARLSAQAATSDPDTPARASANGIRERTLQLSSGYDWNESTGVGADFGYGRFTDHNEQFNALLRFSQRLAASARGRLTWNTYAGYTRDTLSASLAPYFDPARATAEDTELRGEWLGRHDSAAHRSLWHVLTLSAGEYQQSGFGSHPTWAARYEQRWTLSDHSELDFGIARSEHPYDGRPESRTSVSAAYQGRF
jgi:biofilm PGA synthesis protein PgaA